MPKSTKKHKDFFLVQRALCGDQRAYTELYNRYHAPLLNRLTLQCKDATMAEDLVMETFEKAFAVLHTYSPVYTFSTWLFRIGINITIDAVRRSKKDDVTYSLDGKKNDSGDEDDVRPMQVADDAYMPVDTLIHEQRLQFLRECLNRLPPLYKVCLELKYFQGFSCEAIAEELDVAVGTVKSSLHRGKTILQRYARNYMKNELDS